MTAILVQRGQTELGMIKNPAGSWIPAVRWADRKVTIGGDRGLPLSIPTHKQADSFERDRTIPSGFCKGGDHERCRGLVRQPRPAGECRVALCGCRECCHLLYACAECSTRRPLQPTSEPDPDTIDPRTGTCVDRASCASIVNAQDQSPDPLRQMLAEVREAGRAARAARLPTKGVNMPRRPSTDAAAPEQAAAADKPVRTPKPKTGTCQHCGAATKGGLFVAGHDAILKSELISTYVDREKPNADRVDALAEALGRGWVRYSAGHDIAGLVKGLKTDDTEGRATAVKTWDETIYPQAQTKLEKETSEKLLARRVDARIA